MTIYYDVEWHGINELIDAFAYLEEAMIEQINGVGLSAASRVVRDHAKRIVPVKTGKLRDSIKARRVASYVDGKRVPGGGAIVSMGGPGARHAVFVELGTVKWAGSPTVQPAILNTQQQQITALARASSLALQRVVRNLAANTPSRGQRRLLLRGY